MNLKRFLKNRTVQNAGWLVTARVAQMPINFIVGLLTARYLGPSNYGILNYATAYVTFFTAVSTLGINSVLVKELIDRPDRRGETLGTALGLRGIASILSAISITGLVLMVDAGEPITIGVVALSGLALVFHIFEIFNYWFQSRLESKVSAMATLAAFIFTAIYKTILLITGKSVVWFACATSLDYLLLGAFLLFAYKKHNGEKLQFSSAYAREILKKSCHFILPALMVSVYSQTDKMMLKHMLSEAEVGYYATAVQVCNVWCFVLSAIIDSLAPSIMRANQSNQITFKRNNRRLYAIVFYISLIVSFLITLLAKPAISLLYGETYLPAAAPLRIITWYTAFSYLGVARNIWVVCKDCQRYLIFIYLGAAVFNVLLNILLIPRFGTSGAAIASLAAQVITVFILPLFIRPMRENARLMLEAIAFKDIF